MKSGNNKRRFLAGVLSLSMLSTTGALLPTMALTAAAAPAATLLGDINEDNTVSIADVVLLQRYLVQADNTPTAQGLVNADLNSDLAINVFDLVALKQKLASSTVSSGDAGIYLNGTTLTASGTGVTQTSDTIATITAPGEYNVYGSMTGGQIIVNVDKTAYPAGEVDLVLNGISLTNESTSPIYIESIDGECAITAKKDTESVISDGSAAYTNADDDNGAIYAKDDLKFKGKGKLTVNGNYADAIVSKNDVKIWNSTLVVNAADDGIRGKDAVKIGDPDDIADAANYENLNLTVNAKAGDGIKSTETDTTTGKGNINVNGGIINITAYSDGIAASQVLNVAGGTMTITTTCPASGGSSGGGGWNPGGGSSSTSTDVSAKGLKAGCTDDTTSTTIEGTLNITGGTMTINSTDDSVHATDVNISGGLITATSGDDGVHADDILTISGGEVNVLKSYEGLEAYDLKLKGGIMRLVASDDGINAAGGNDSSGTTNPGGWNPGGMSTSSGIVNISGGYLYVRANGDCLDSNGNFTVSGGTVIACGPTSGGNGIFDKGDGSYTLSFTGGTVFGIGTSDMMETPSTSNGTYLVASSGVSLQAGNLFSAADASGNVVAVLQVPSDMNMTGAIQFYSTEANSSTALYSGGSYNGTLNSDGFATGGTISGASTVSTSGGGNINPWG